MSFENYSTAPIGFAHYPITLDNRSDSRDMYVTVGLFARFLEEFRGWDCWPEHFSYTIRYQHTSKPLACSITIGDEAGPLDDVFDALELQLADLLGKMNKEAAHGSED